MIMMISERTQFILYSAILFAISIFSAFISTWMFVFLFTISVVLLVLYLVLDRVVNRWMLQVGNKMAESFTKDQKKMMAKFLRKKFGGNDDER